MTRATPRSVEIIQSGRVQRGRLPGHAGAADWLEDRRIELGERLGEDLPRPVFAEKPGAAEAPEVARIRAALLVRVSAETRGRTGEEQARALLADLLDWHRREGKPAGWRHLYVRTLSPAELIGEPDALGGLTGGGRGGQGQEAG